MSGERELAEEAAALVGARVAEPVPVRAAVDASDVEILARFWLIVGVEEWGNE